MSRFMKWTFLSLVLGIGSVVAVPASAQAQGISIGLYGNNGGVFYNSNPYYVQPYPYSAYYAPRVYVPVVQPYPVYGGYYGGYRPGYGGHRHPGHHHHHGHHGHHH